VDGRWDAIGYVLLGKGRHDLHPLSGIRSYTSMTEFGASDEGLNERLLNEVPA